MLPVRLQASLFHQETVQVSVHLNSQQETGSAAEMMFVFSLLATSDGSKKLPADRISVWSSGSSGSEVEDVSSLNSACSIRPQVSGRVDVTHASSRIRDRLLWLQSFHSSCSNVSSSSDSPPPSDPPPEPCPPASHHKRSVSMTSLPAYNRQGADSCVVRVNVDLGRSNGNMYKSILVS